MVAAAMATVVAAGAEDVKGTLRNEVAGWIFGDWIQPAGATFFSAAKARICACVGVQGTAK